MTDSTEDLDETPSTTEEIEREEGKMLAEGWLRVATVSIFALVLLVVGLLQATGLIDLVPFGDDWTLEWLVFVLLACVLVAIELGARWSSRQ